MISDNGERFRAEIRASRKTVARVKKDVTAENDVKTVNAVVGVESARKDGMRCASATPDETVIHKTTIRFQTLGLVMMIRTKVCKTARQRTNGRKAGFGEKESVERRNMVGRNTRFGWVINTTLRMSVMVVV